MQCGYIGENKHRLKTRIKEHSGNIKTRTYSNTIRIHNVHKLVILIVLISLIVIILISGSRSFSFKEAMSIFWKKPISNKQIKRAALTFLILAILFFHFLFPFPSSLVFPRISFLFHNLILLLLF